MSAQRLLSELLARAGGLLLEYNESTGAIHRTLLTTANGLTSDECHVSVAYGGISVSLADALPATQSVHEIRYNSVVQSRVHEILSHVRRRELDPNAALSQLADLAANPPRHPRTVAIVVLGLAAASLALLLGADISAAAIAGVATSVGLVVRQELGRRHFALLSLPFAAALLGAVIGGLAIRRGATETPELVLIVPALMLVPGPHLINGILDLLDNHLPMCVARLGLATGILLACALGIVLGMVLTLPLSLVRGEIVKTLNINVLIDMLLSGITACGFAVFYNTAWKQVGLAAVGGMLGHGARYVALRSGLSLELSTFLGGLMVGLVAAWLARTDKTPVAVISFAGAVTMMPGLAMYRALGGAMKLAHTIPTVDVGLISDILANAIQASLVVGALALGLILGARLVQAYCGEFAEGTARS